MIDLQNVYLAFGELKVLDGLSLNLEAGGRMCIVGKSGTGKSVLMKVMTGLLKPQRGEVFLDGARVTNYTEAEWCEVRHNFGMVFQNAALLDSLTVEENVGIRLLEEHRHSRKLIRDRVVEELERVGLDAEVLPKLPNQLSGGMRKRVAIARAIIHRPRFLFYDEPTAGLDPQNSNVVDDLIESLSQTEPDITSVIITHDLDSVKRLGDRVLMLNAGRIAYWGDGTGFWTDDEPVVQAFLARYHERV